MACNLLVEEVKYLVLTTKKTTRMKNTTLCIASLLGGMAIGSVLAMAFTPKSGEEMRHLVRNFLSDELAKWHNSCCSEGAQACDCDKK